MKKPEKFIVLTYGDMVHRKRYRTTIDNQMLQLSFLVVTYEISPSYDHTLVDDMQSG